MAVARLGGSDHPLDSFDWVEDPSLHGAGRTVIQPAVTLEVQQDGSVRPFLPSTIQFRDGNLLRPTAPFLELWAKVSGVQDLQPLTTALLGQNQATLANVSYTVTAANRKAARRTGDDACAYSASITVLGNDNTPQTLAASSVGPRPLVSPDRPIPLGTFQVIRPASATQINVNLDTLRVRYTPARGLVYGPPGAVNGTDQETGRTFEMVPAANRILNTDASWITYNADETRFDNPLPGDTYDGADDSTRRELSFGVVDDTCDVIIEAVVVVNNTVRLSAMARVFTAPPDYAPDRRPFVSLADELIDRDPPANETPEPLDDAIERVGDFFRRAYETASLANVDAMRDRSLTGQSASQFPPPTTLKDSMTARDSLFNRTDDLTVRPTTHEHLPYASVAHVAHEPLADVEDLTLFLRTNAQRVKAIVRPPFGAFSELPASVDANAAPNPDHRDPRNNRDNLFDMRMPPYMRDADASPLSITRRQYRTLMDLVQRLQAPPAPAAGAAPGAPLAAAALPETPVRKHVRRVVERRGSQTPPAPQGGAAPGGAAQPPQKPAGKNDRGGPKRRGRR
jgi:hypothetical protein